MLIPTLDQASLENAAFYAGMITAVFIVIVYSLNVLKEGAKKKRNYEKRKQRYMEREDWKEERREKKRVQELKEKHHREFCEGFKKAYIEMERKNKIKEYRNRETLKRTFNDIRNNI